MNVSENNNNDNKNILISIIIILLIIISILGFFLWKKIGSSWGNIATKPNSTKNEVWNNITSSWTNSEDITVTVYDDKRCTACQTEDIVKQLKLIPTLANAKIINKDFADTWVDKYLKDNSITALPAIIFNTSSVDASINSYLKAITSWDYSLQVWATFNPYAKRSDKWFLVIETSKVKDIIDKSYIKWKVDAKITWLEYSDLECSFCAKLHNSWTIEEIEKKFPDTVNMVYNHFPLEFHPNAQIWAEILECAWEQKGSDIFYNLITKSFKDSNSTKDFLITTAVWLGAKKDLIEKCLTDKKYTDKVKGQMTTWSSLFNITWTPWNVIINNETGEYEVLAWAYPTASFETIINKLLWK